MGILCLQYLFLLVIYKSVTVATYQIIKCIHVFYIKGLEILPVKKIYIYVYMNISQDVLF